MLGFTGVVKPSTPNKPSMRLISFDCLPLRSHIGKSSSNLDDQHEARDMVFRPRKLGAVEHFQF